MGYSSECHCDRTSVGAHSGVSVSIPWLREFFSEKDNPMSGYCGRIPTLLW
jgi:hypothetical protein